MRLSELALPGRIRVELAARDAREAIEELLALLVDDGSLPPAWVEEARAAVLERESIQTTGMTHGVALPHAALPGLDDVVAGIGTSREGIDWPCLDGRPAHIVVLLLVPENRLQVHVRALAAMARLLNDPPLRAAITAAATPEEVAREIDDAEA